jgi:electron transport complex protein RnfE
MIREFTKGILRENPIFVVVIGICPALAVSTRVVNALGMGAGVIIVLLGSNLAVSVLRDFIPEKVRIPAFLGIIAVFVTIVDLLMQAYLPELSKNLGIFVPLMTVNCIILGRAEAFAGNTTPGPSLFDALGMGFGFALGLTVISLIRELLGSGTVTLFPFGNFNGIIEVPGLVKSPLGIFMLPAGAFFVMGYLKALFDVIMKRSASNGKKEDVS